MRYNLVRAGKGWFFEADRTDTVLCIVIRCQGDMFFKRASEFVTPNMSIGVWGKHIESPVPE
jgi:hypothetical protein